MQMLLILLDWAVAGQDVTRPLVVLPPSATPDVIVFNEVLYYVADPVAVVQRYRTALAPGGLVIVSVFHDNLRTWKAINQSLASESLQTTVVHELSSGKSRYLGVYQAGPPPR